MRRAAIGSICRSRNTSRRSPSRSVVRQRPRPAPHRDRQAGSGQRRVAMQPRSSAHGPARSLQRIGQRWRPQAVARVARKVSRADGLQTTSTDIVSAFTVDLRGTLDERIDEGVGHLVEHRAQQRLEHAVRERVGQLELHAASRRLVRGGRLQPDRAASAAVNRHTPSSCENGPSTSFEPHRLGRHVFVACRERLPDAGVRQPQPRRHPRGRARCRVGGVPLQHGARLAPRQELRDRPRPRRRVRTFRVRNTRAGRTS